MTTELQGLLERVVRLLDAAGVPFMIAGSFASAAHGLPRATQDLDLVVDPPGSEALEAFVRSLSPDEYYVDADAARDALRHRSMFNVVDHASRLLVQCTGRDLNPYASRRRNLKPIGQSMK